MDIKAKVEELAVRILNDEKLQAKFRKDPVAAVEELIGIDLPNDQIEKVAELVKARIGAEKLGDALGALGNIFGRK